MLSRLGMSYLDLSWILTAYQREQSSEGKPAAGTHNPDPPPSPWHDREELQRRCQTLQEDLG
jgi:hypothetical protein